MDSLSLDNQARLFKIYQHRERAPCRLTDAARCALPNPPLLVVPFKIAPELISESPLNSSNIFRLPPEILINIFQHTETIADSICLAVSCKALLGIAQLCNLQVPNRKLHLPAWNPEVPLDQADAPLCECNKIQVLLKRFQPRNFAGVSNPAWGLCDGCLRYLPTRKSYWAGRAKANSEEWEQREGKKWDSMVEDFANGVEKVDCPSCVVGLWEFWEFNWRMA